MNNSFIFLLILFIKSKPKRQSARLTKFLVQKKSGADKAVVVIEEIPITKLNAWMSSFLSRPTEKQSIGFSKEFKVKNLPSFF